MTDFTVSEMQIMQQNLQDKYKDKWEPISPETGKNKMLWMIAEMGEVIDIVKKNSIDQIMEEGEIRKWFVEEMADVLMFYNDMMLCYGITVDELKQSYTEKYEKNMKRW
ncbi:MAG: MazG nucleotide pyrophosphohydrolase domain-containing protein [Bacillota bacterium]|nr:MazG nucleotide pyrophosphohydrolase domain-containing protein [Bacillota bacterium]